MRALAGRRPRPAHVLAGVLLAALSVRVALVGAPQLDYDEGVYWQSLRSMASGHRLYGEIFSSQPPGFLLLLQPGFALGGHSLLAARLTVALLSLTLLVGVWLLARGVAGEWWALVPTVVAGFDPLLLRGSVTLQADVPAIGLAALGLSLLVAAVDAEGAKRAWLGAGAGALLGAAVMVKFLAAPAVAGGLALLVTQRADRRLVLPACAGGLAVAGLLLAPFLGDLGQVWAQSVGLHLGGRGVVSPPFGSGWPVPVLGETVITVLAAAGLARAFRIALFPGTLAAGVWLVAGAAFLAIQRPVYPHHLAALLAPASVLTGIAVAGTRFRPAYGLALVVAAIAGSMVVIGTLPGRPPLEAGGLAAAVPAGGPVVTDDQFGAAAAGLDTPPWLVDTSRLRVASGELTAGRVEAEIARARVRAVILATGRLDRLDGFQPWLLTSFPERQQLGQTIIFSRPPPG